MAKEIKWHPNNTEHLTWDERLRRAWANEGKFNEEDVKLANSFTSCAISERPKLKRLYDKGSEWMSKPTEAYNLVENLGYAFFHAVQNNDVAAADYLFVSIQSADKVVKQLERAQKAVSK